MTPKLISNLFLAWVMFTPWMLGGNRVWALAILAPLLALISIAHCWVQARAATGAQPPVAFPRLPAGVFAALVCLVLLQWMPVSDGVLSFLSPAAAEVWSGTRALQGEGGSFAVSLDSYQTHVSLLRLFIYANVFYLTWSLFRRPEDLRRLGYTIVAAGTLEALFAIAMVATRGRYSLLDTTVVNEVANGSFVNRGHFAAYMVTCLSIGVGMMVGKISDPKGPRSWRQRFRDWLKLVLSSKARLRVLLVLMVVALILTRSRMGNFSFFFALGMLGAAHMWATRKIHRGFVILIVSMVVVDTVLIGSWVGLGELAQRVQDTTPTDVAVRQAASFVALDLLRLFPVLGSGAGSYYVMYFHHASPDDPNWYEHAHSDFLELASEMGIPAFLMVAALIAVSTLKALAVARNEERRVVRGMAFGAFMAICGAVTHATMEFNLQMPANAILFSIVLALPWAMSARAGRVAVAAAPADAVVEPASVVPDGGADASPHPESPEPAASRRSKRARRSGQ